MNELILSTTFEEVQGVLSRKGLNYKLMEFIESLPDTESTVAYIARESRHAGKLAFVLGAPGKGKSTFIHSLNWRKNVQVEAVVNIDANDYVTQGLDSIYEELKRLGDEAKSRYANNPLCVVIDYLEDLSGFEDGHVRAFFRRLNGLLRTNPLLVLWPVTENDAVKEMIDYTKAISGTIFVPGYEVVNFDGPSFHKYAEIAARSIAILNDGKELTDFSLTMSDLSELQEKMFDIPYQKRTLRDYLHLVKQRWQEQSQYHRFIRSSIPKPTEIWFVFPYPQAESVVAQFVRRSKRIDDNWAVIYDKFYDYLGEGQRSTYWNPSRLQMALSGAFKTRVMYLPTNVLISSIYAFSNDESVTNIIERSLVPKNWRKRSSAIKFLKRTAFYKQIVEEPIAAGMRRGGPAAEAISIAEPSYRDLVHWISSGGKGSDKVFNRSLASVLCEVLDCGIASDKRHPWLTNVIPDIFLDFPDKQVCVEFHYTADPAAYKIADYSLKKLDVYMREIEGMTNQGLS